MTADIAAVVLPGLPEALTQDYERTAVTAADAEEILRLVCDCDIAVLGYPDWSLEDVESEIAPTAQGSRDQALVRRRRDGRIVSWWWTDPRAGTPQYVSDVYVDPSLDAPDGDAIALAGWAAVETWARQWFQGPHGVDVERPYLDVGSLLGDDATERRLAAYGFEQLRTFWRMSGAVPDEPRPAPQVPGLRIAGAQDPHLVHRLKEEIFVDHWGNEPTAYDVWADRLQRGPGYDPGLWRLAWVDGELAGLMLCSRQMAAEGALYVMTVGTRSAYRGRGIAGALLHHAFEMARAEGYTRVALGVDSDSPTGAPGVYRRAGLEVQFAMHAWHKQLTWPAAAVSGSRAGP